MSGETSTTGDWSVVARQQAAVAELGKLGLVGVPLDHLLQEAALSVAHVMQNDSVVLLELLPADEGFRVRAASHDGDVVPARRLQGVTVPSGGASQAGYTLMMAVPVISDTETEERFTPAARGLGPGSRSGVTATIGWEDRPWGVLGSHSSVPRAYTEDDVHFLESVANVVGLAIQRVVVEDELREHSARLDLSLAAGGLGSWHWEPGSDRVALSASLEQLFGCEPGSFRGKPADVLELVHQEDREAVRTSLQRAVAERSEHHLTYRVVRPDGVVRWLESRGRVVVEADGVRMRVVGVAADVTEQRLVDEIKSSLLGREHQARVEAERARERLSFLAAASASLTSSLDPAVIYRDLAGLVVPRLCDICLVDAFDDDGLLVETAVLSAPPDHADLLHEMRRRRVAAGGDGIWSVRRAVRGARSELVHEITDEQLVEAAGDDAHLDMLRSLAPRSVMVVPLVARGRVLGGMTLIATDGSRRYDEDDLTLAEDLAARAAMAVDNALLLESRTLVARSLQASLLPPALPILAHLDLAARYRVAEGDIEIGGDFYDVFELEAGRWAAVIGDVCGRGPEAAALTGLMRHSVRAAAVRDDQPSHVLGQTNDAILDQIDDTRFCTAAFVRLVPPTGSGQPAHLVVACGGHPRPMVLRADGSVERVDAPGTLLGVIPDPPLVDVAVSLEAGSSLVLYTDGVTEARRSGVQLGEAGLMKLLCGLQHLGAEALAEHVDRAVGDWQDADSDDMAVMVLRVEPA